MPARDLHNSETLHQSTCTLPLCVLAWSTFLKSCQVLFDLYLQVIVWAGSFSGLAFLILAKTGFLRIDEAAAVLGEGLKGSIVFYHVFFRFLPRSKVSDLSKRRVKHMKKYHRNLRNAKHLGVHSKG